VSGRLDGVEPCCVDVRTRSIQHGRQRVVLAVCCGLLWCDTRPDDADVLGSLQRRHVLQWWRRVVLELQCRVCVSIGLDDCDAGDGSMQRRQVLARRGRGVSRLPRWSIRRIVSDVVVIVL
jgi:hypothetical protein